MARKVAGEHKANAFYVLDRLPQCGPEQGEYMAKVQKGTWPGTW